MYNNTSHAACKTSEVNKARCIPAKTSLSQVRQGCYWHHCIHNPFTNGQQLWNYPMISAQTISKHWGNNSNRTIIPSPLLWIHCTGLFVQYPQDLVNCAYTCLRYVVVISNVLKCSFLWNYKCRLHASMQAWGCRGVHGVDYIIMQSWAYIHAHRTGSIRGCWIPQMCGSLGWN